MRIFLFLLLASFAAQSQVPTAQKAKDTYVRLAEDFFDEVMTMDAVVEPISERQEMVTSFKKILLSPQANRYRFKSTQTWSAHWPPDRSALGAEVSLKHGTAKPGAVDQTYLRIPAKGMIDGRHSIKDLRKYIESRLGRAAFLTIEQGLVTPVVLGGSERSISQLLGVDNADLYKIPSLYEAWGISKWFVPGTAFVDQRPRLIFVVPPATEYLEHYQYMLKVAAGREQMVVKNQHDFKAWKVSFSEAADRVIEGLSVRPDYISLGYFNQWPQVIEQNKQKLEAVEIGPVVTDKSGLLSRQIVFKALASGKRISILTLGHQKTIWGEASAELVGAFLKHRPRGVLFLGSAGSLTSKAMVYDLSVPSQFRTKTGEVPVSNFIQNTKSAAGTPSEGINIVYEAIHGHTPSPAVQTEGYLLKKLASGEDTIDVEQGLVAKKVAEFNLAESAKIEFGAINLITDKPMAHLDLDLDNIDVSKKSNSRLKAVGLALNALSIRSVQPMSCRQVLY